VRGAGARRAARAVQGQGAPRRSRPVGRERVYGCSSETYMHSTEQKTSSVLTKKDVSGPLTSSVVSLFSLLELLATPRGPSPSVRATALLL
jgi:hypothetical protein